MTRTCRSDGARLATGIWHALRPSTASILSVALCLLPAASRAAGPGTAETLAGATSAPFPELTLAPLVTPAPLPGIVAPLTRDQGIPVDGYALGDPAAPVTVEVYEDFQCPYCHQFTLQVEPQLVDAYIRPGMARLVFHDLPFLGEESQWAAVAGRLASEQGLFWPMHDYLFANQLGENVGSFTPDRLMTMAQAAGLDMGSFIAGLQVPAARATFAQIQAEAIEAASTRGVRATPTVFVNGVAALSPDLATVSAAIDAAMTPAPSIGEPGAVVGGSSSPAP